MEHNTYKERVKGVKEAEGISKRVRRPSAGIDKGIRNAAQDQAGINWGRNFGFMVPLATGLPGDLSSWKKMWKKTQSN